MIPSLPASRSMFVVLMVQSLLLTEDLDSVLCMCDNIPEHSDGIQVGVILHGTISVVGCGYSRDITYILYSLRVRLTSKMAVAQ